ncbi:MAG: adenylate/guanylate cyclase domain-containing protein [Candidatus Riflebacteria bacterium HGW-Riflebacteria-2]|jgi:adenylate cyclase|nr:MAG: adenylate/guanylate cyclase domain-containing protein [Candidatus Riflebacteria bacterium HGW-Riflebacteria-2]
METRADIKKTVKKNEGSTPAIVLREQKKRLAEAELLLDISRRISAMDSLDAVLKMLVETATSRLNAERGSLFLNDPNTNELYSRVAMGNFMREIRILNTNGIAGYVFTSGEGIIIPDAYADSRFNRNIDEQTGFVTRNILCVPIKTAKGQVMAVAQILNKNKGRFNREDMRLLEEMMKQGAPALQSLQFIEQMETIRRQELEFINVVSEMTSDIKLGSLLQNVMAEATRMLNAERSTLFLHDDKSDELWSEVGQGLESTQIRMPSHAGIAGAVFKSSRTINIPHAYADLRFNPSFDKKTGFFTRSILCVPVINKNGRTIGVTQVLNKHGGPFSQEDEARLRAFTAQVSIALENAKLFADVQAMKNYNEAMLESMSNGLITLDVSGRIATCNAACSRILKISGAEIIGRKTSDYFIGDNAWVLEKLRLVNETGEQQTSVDAPLSVGDERLSVNLTVQSLLNIDQKRIGTMIIIEDISNEKRLKSTMSRYMDPAIADKLLASGTEILGGTNVECTVLFADIRGFTTLTEQLGPQGTVALLNEYFTLMVDCIQQEHGMLDKFIGDAIMAAFGIPVPHDDDADRSVRAAVAMIEALYKWNRLRTSEGRLPVNIGIGLNTDTVVSGNIGSCKRMDFTIIGDGVNLASRLESACKQYGTKILISEFTMRRLKGTYRQREIDLVVVKGKTQPVAIFEILSYHNRETFPGMGEVLGMFKDGLAAYRARKWDAAIKLFTDCLAINPDDKPSKIYVERAQFLKGNPPPEDWSGVWVMESK